MLEEFRVQDLPGSGPGGFRVGFQFRVLGLGRVWGLGLGAFGVWGYNELRA